MNREIFEQIIQGMLSGKMSKVAAARILKANMPAEVKELPASNGISTYFHCRQCLRERPSDQSPADWARLSVGFTNEGLQVWCWRHGINVAHIHFQGQQHPANLAAGKPDAENRTERSQS